MLRKIPLRKTIRNLLYFGIPVLLALSSAIFPIKPVLRQAMIGFVLIWFIAGCWLVAPSQ